MDDQKEYEEFLTLMLNTWDQEEMAYMHIIVMGDEYSGSSEGS